MTFRSFSCIAFLATLLATFCAQPLPERSFMDEYEPGFAVSQSVNIFGADLLVEYRKKQNPSNSVVFSPLNLVTTFQLLYKGAGGETKSQMDNLLYFSNHEVEERLTGKGQDLAQRGAASMAYRVYVDNSIQLLEDYLEHVGSNRVLSVDFVNNSESIRDEINEWVSNKTNGLIPTIVSEGDITSMTVMALVNALYFKGTWKHAFNPKLTEKGVFHGVNGDQNVSYMTLHDRYLDYKEVPELNGIMFELPYAEKDFGMYVLLPDNADGWKQAEQAYPDYAANIFSASFTRTKVSVLELPKWEMEFTFEGLIDGLVSLGIVDLFSPNADLSAMTNSTQLIVSAMIHKAKIIVNEEGTEAAAATVAVVARSASISIPFTITVNRPFLYFIVDKSDGTVLFQGTQTSFP